jgi:hypothetical protein
MQRWWVVQLVINDIDQPSTLYRLSALLDVI